MTYNLFSGTLNPTHFTSLHVTARHSSSERQPNFVALTRGRHLYSAGRPSRWALVHISSLQYMMLLDSVYVSFSCCAGDLLPQSEQPYLNLQLVCILSCWVCLDVCSDSVDVLWGALYSCGSVRLLCTISVCEHHSDSCIPTTVQVTLIGRHYRSK